MGDYGGPEGLSGITFASLIVDDSQPDDDSDVETEPMAPLPGGVARRSMTNAQANEPLLFRGGRSSDLDSVEFFHLSEEPMSLTAGLSLSPPPEELRRDQPSFLVPVHPLISSTPTGGGQDHASQGGRQGSQVGGVSGYGYSGSQGGSQGERDNEFGGSQGGRGDEFGGSQGGSQGLATMRTTTTRSLVTTETATTTTTDGAQSIAKTHVVRNAVYSGSGSGSQSGGGGGGRGSGGGGGSGGHSDGLNAQVRPNSGSGNTGTPVQQQSRQRVTTMDGAGLFLSPSDSANSSFNTSSSSSGASPFQNPAAARVPAPIEPHVYDMGLSQELFTPSTPTRTTAEEEAAALADAESFADSAVNIVTPPRSGAASASASGSTAVTTTTTTATTTTTTAAAPPASTAASGSTSASLPQPQPHSRQPTLALHFVESQFADSPSQNSSHSFNSGEPLGARPIAAATSSGGASSTHVSSTTAATAAVSSATSSAGGRHQASPATARSLSATPPMTHRRRSPPPLARIPIVDPQSRQVRPPPNSFAASTSNPQLLAHQAPPSATATTTTATATTQDDGDALPPTPTPAPTPNVGAVAPSSAPQRSGTATVAFEELSGVLISGESTVAGTPGMASGNVASTGGSTGGVSGGDDAGGDDEYDDTQQGSAPHLSLHFTPSQFTMTQFSQSQYGGGAEGEDEPAVRPNLVKPVLTKSRSTQPDTLSQDGLIITAGPPRPASSAATATSTTTSGSDSSRLLGVSAATANRLGEPLRPSSQPGAPSNTPLSGSMDGGHGGGGRDGDDEFNTAASSAAAADSLLGHRTNSATTQGTAGPDSFATPARLGLSLSLVAQSRANQESNTTGPVARVGRSTSPQDDQSVIPQGRVPGAPVLSHVPTVRASSNASSSVLLPGGRSHSTASSTVLGSARRGASVTFSGVDDELGRGTGVSGVGAGDAVGDVGGDGDGGRFALGRPGQQQQQHQEESEPNTFPESLSPLSAPPVRARQSGATAATAYYGGGGGGGGTGIDSLLSTDPDETQPTQLSRPAPPQSSTGGGSGATSTAGGPGGTGVDESGGGTVDDDQSSQVVLVGDSPAIVTRRSAATADSAPRPTTTTTTTTTTASSTASSTSAATAPKTPPSAASGNPHPGSEAYDDDDETQLSTAMSQTPHEFRFVPPTASAVSNDSSGVSGRSGGGGGGGGDDDDDDEEEDDEVVFKRTGRRKRPRVIEDSQELGSVVDADVDGEGDGDGGEEGAEERPAKQQRTGEQSGGRRGSGRGSSGSRQASRGSASKRSKAADPFAFTAEQPRKTASLRRGGLQAATDNSPPQQPTGGAGPGKGYAVERVGATESQTTNPGLLIMPRQRTTVQYRVSPSASSAGGPPTKSPFLVGSASRGAAGGAATSGGGGTGASGGITFQLGNRRRGAMRRLGFGQSATSAATATGGAGGAAGGGGTTGGSTGAAHGNAAPATVNDGAGSGSGSGSGSISDEPEAKRQRTNGSGQRPRGPRIRPTARFTGALSPTFGTGATGLGLSSRIESPLTVPSPAGSAGGARSHSGGSLSRSASLTTTPPSRGGSAGSNSAAASPVETPARPANPTVRRRSSSSGSTAKGKAPAELSSSTGRGAASAAGRESSVDEAANSGSPNSEGVAVHLGPPVSANAPAELDFVRKLTPQCAACQASTTTALWRIFEGSIVMCNACYGVKLCGDGNTLFSLMMSAGGVGPQADYPPVWNIFYKGTVPAALGASLEAGHRAVKSLTANTSAGGDGGGDSGRGNTESPRPGRGRGGGGSGGGGSTGSGGKAASSRSNSRKRANSNSSSNRGESGRTKTTTSTKSNTSKRGRASGSKRKRSEAIERTESPRITTPQPLTGSRQSLRSRRLQATAQASGASTQSASRRSKSSTRSAATTSVSRSATRTTARSASRTAGSSTATPRSSRSRSKTAGRSRDGSGSESGSEPHSSVRSLTRKRVQPGLSSPSLIVADGMSSLSPPDKAAKGSKATTAATTTAATSRDRGGGGTVETETRAGFDSDELSSGGELGLDDWRERARSASYHSTPQSRGGSQNPAAAATSSRGVFDGISILLTGLRTTADDGSGSFTAHTDHSVAGSGHNARAELQAAILAAGGKVIQEIPKEEVTPGTLFVAADSPQRTHKYLVAVARGIPIVHTSWVRESVRTGVLADVDPRRLSNGLSYLTNNNVTLPGGKQLLAGMNVSLVGGEQFFGFYAPLVRALGAESVSTALRNNADLAIFDKFPDLDPKRSKTLRKARGRNVPCVGYEWLIQSVICQTRVPFNEAMFDPNYEPSSSMALSQAV